MEEESLKQKTKQNTKYSNGGDDDGKWRTFSSYRSFSRVCRPDPDNPGKMLCTEKEESRNSPFLDSPKQNIREIIYRPDINETSEEKLSLYGRL